MDGTVLHVSVPETSQEGPVRRRIRDAVTVVIYGATGDLTWRKLIPAFHELQTGGFLPENYLIVAFARRDKSDEEFRKEVTRGIDGGEELAEFASRIFYHRGDLDTQADFDALGDHLASLEKAHDLPGNRLHYLATSPEYFGPVVAQLDRAGLITGVNDEHWTRVVVEKPFGTDLESARALNREMGEILHEDQVYRIDHYLGKETVQNILSFRFGNAIFEPLFNRRYVDHVQITVGETLGMEGRRGGYYDTAGALRDMMQNHVLQLLCLVGMEPPSSMTAKDIRDEKLKLLRALIPLHGADVRKSVVRGQYVAGEVDGKAVKGYREEEGVDPRSTTETFVAMQLGFDNWRWAGVPFFLRTGKRLRKRVSEIAIQFRLPPLQLFTTVQCTGDECDITRARPNVLTFRIQPDESITLSFSSKRPGPEWQLQPVRMEFDYGSSYHRKLPEAYERLLLDVMRGDSTLFTRADEVEAAWTFFDPIISAWREAASDLHEYAPGSWGPGVAARLCDVCEGDWRNP